MFSVRTHAEQQLARYLEVFPEEAPGLSALASQLRDDTGDVFSRANMRGHITTSSVVYDPAADKVLVVHHKLYDRWLYPGGHQEGNGLLSDSAARENGEEAGVLTVLHPWHQKFDAPLDIDTHPIGAQPKKNEGEHFHHDFIYLFNADSTKPLVAQLEEVYGTKWISRGDFGALPGDRFKRLARKLARVIGEQ